MNRKELDHYLIGEAWTSTEAYASLERLCDMGSRFAGSAGGRAARDFILERFKAYGLSQTRLEPFDFLVWTRGPCELRLLAGSHAEPKLAVGTLASQPRLMRSALALVYSPDADHLRAEVADCGIGSEREFARHPEGALRGKIVMVSSANLERGPAIHRREKFGRAVAAGAAGFIYVNHKPGVLAETGSLRSG